MLAMASLMVSEGVPNVLLAAAVLRYRVLVNVMET